MGPKRQSLKLGNPDIAILLLGASVLPMLYAAWGNSGFAEMLFVRPADVLLGDLQALVFQFAVFFLLGLVLPVLHIKAGMRRSLAGFGLGAGTWKTGWLIAIVVIALLVVPMSWLGSRMPEVRAEYPLWGGVYGQAGRTMIYYLAYAGLYYLGWEFFFRGYLLFGLAGRFGELNAVLIQTIPSVLLHIGKPTGELVGAVPFGIALGFVALRTGSIWYGFAIHVALGLLTDLFVVFGSV